MAAISNSRRAAAGIALIVAGVLFLLAILLPLVGLALPLLVAFAYLALAAALVIVALGAVNSTLAKIALVLGALGWLILAIAALGVAGFPGQVLIVAALLAAAGGLVGAIVLYVGREITNRSAVLFIVAMALAALYLLLPYLVPLAALSFLIVLLLGAALIVTGIYFRRTVRKG